MLGIDVGGTFTDFIEIDGDGNISVAKVPSVPDSPADGVLAGLRKLAEAHGTLPDYLSKVDLIVHGTTISTNAVITRRYAKTGYVTTKGLRDILNSRRGVKRNAFTAKEAPPEPIVPQHLVRVVDERIDRNGAVVKALNEAEVRAAAAYFREQRVEAVAVCYMFSFLNPAHEIRTQAILQEELPEVYVTVSSRVLPQVRLYERGSTTVFNACIGPLLRTYIGDLQRKLGSAGFKGRLLTMQSNGGVMSPEVVKEFGANTLLSGPASGPIAGAFFAKPHRLSNLITIDMGGTSLDACLVRDGQAAVTNSSEVAEYALSIPSLDINAIGAGGGSIASVTEAGLLQVGPQSAGAVPGPVAYGQGGRAPTVTDADLVLGYLNPDYFLGGEKRLDINLAAAAIDEKVGSRLGLSATEAALGIVKFIDAQMANGVRAVSVARGFDPREACLVAAGGAGPLHACGIADELDMDLILVPKSSSVLCATGMLTTHLRQDLTRFAFIRLDEATSASARLSELCAELMARGRDILSEQRVPEDRWRFEFSCDMQFEGQFNVLNTRLPVLDRGTVTSSDIAAIRTAFEQNHDRVYGYVLKDAPVEIQSIRLTAIGVRDQPRFRKIGKARSGSAAAIKGKRRAWFSAAAVDVPLFEGSRLECGHEIAGPAIVEQPTTTIKVDPEWRARIDAIGSILMWRAGVDFTTTLDRLIRPSVT